MKKYGQTCLPLKSILLKTGLQQFTLLDMLMDMLNGYQLYQKSSAKLVSIEDQKMWYNNYY